MAAAPAKRNDDARKRSKAAIERRLRKTSGYFNDRKKKPYPNMRNRPDAY